MNLMEKVAAETNVPEDIVAKVTESLLMNLHRRLVEYREGNGDYFGELAWSEMTDRAFYHLLGFVEQLTQKYGWEEGTIVEYLGRLPPTDRWKNFNLEIKDWKWKH
jgi:hypothetical protein